MVKFVVQILRTLENAIKKLIFSSKFSQKSMKIVHKQWQEKDE